MEWFWLEDHEEALKTTYSGDYREGAWEGPGWYWVKLEKRSCIKGCCKHPVEIFSSASSFIEECEDKIRKLQKEIRQLESEIAEAKLKVNENEKVLR